MSVILSKQQLGEAKTRLVGIFKATGSSEVVLELNRGCSTGCPFCCYSSSKGVDRPMPFQLVETARQAMTELKDGAPLAVYTYFRGDSFDYQLDGKDVRDIWKLFGKTRVHRYTTPNEVKTNITTSVPAGSEGRVRAAIEEGIGMRLTLSFMNEARLLANPWFRQLFKDMRLEKKSAVASFAMVDDKTMEKRWPRYITKSELFIWLEELLDETYSTKGIFRECGNNIIYILGSANGAYLHRVEGRAKGLPVISNQMQFSRMVLEGKLKPGEQFVCEYWEADAPKPGRELPYNMEILLRNWAIQPWGRVYGKHFASAVDDGCGPTSDTVLMTSDGAIWLLESRKKNHSGIALKNLYPLLY